METHKVHLIRDSVIIFLSIVVAVFLLQSGVLNELLSATQEVTLVGSFVAGFLFTTVFTISLAAVVLGEIAAKSDSIFSVAFIGGIGAVMGDLIIFHFVKDSLAEDLEFIFQKIKNENLMAVFHHKLMKWFIPLIGALIIASPLPDELGITIMGFAKLKTTAFIPISFLFNFLGILVIGLIAKNLL